MKRFAAAAERNKEPIGAVLREVLPESGTVLEIGSGTGQHAAYFAGALPGLIWLPSDRDPEAVASIAAYRAEAGLDNLAEPLVLDATAEAWPLERADAVVCINMIHIAAWSACLGVLRGSARLLELGAPLVFYGPFRIDGDFTAPSNAAFDQRLRGENPEWGVRELREIEHAAGAFGLVLDRVVARPANNHVVVFTPGQFSAA
jgi:SAM-dependent methyltransferase